MNDKLEIKSLTKEFWNELQEKYPAGMKVFCEWIDEYKKANKWELLFNASNRQVTKTAFIHVKAKAPKYHDLPFAMQIGIFMQFMKYKKINIQPVLYVFTPMGLDWMPLIRETIESLNEKA